MNLIKSLMIIMVVVMSAKSFARGGDDVGNGGFAYKQSVNILKMATEALEEKIRVSELPDLVNHPEWRVILQDTLGYEDLDKLSKKNRYRGGRKLAMDYVVNPPTVIVLKPYFEAFMGKTDTELEDASLEVQKRLVHEAAHIWGFKEDDADKFAVAFMRRPVADAQRPNHDISIASNFCSCINGKSDIINNCDAFCATKPKNEQAILYVNTILGEQTINHPKLGSLYKWCAVQLSQDETTPQCSLIATDGDDEVSIPVNVTPKNNSFSANISSLSKNRTWILKLAETRTGNEAQTKEFQIRRVHSTPTMPGGVLNVSSVNQYTCLFFGGKTNSNGDIIRDSYARLFYYYPSLEDPSPMPPSNGPASVLCHDDQLYPGNDSSLYERLENVKAHVGIWDKNDRRFVSSPSNGGQLNIDKEIQDRLSSEYGIETNINLFRSISFASGPKQVNTFLGFMMIPFIIGEQSNAFCPTSATYTGNLPLMNLLGEYMSDTEALYVAEKEGEIISDGINDRTLYGTMLVRESVINKYGFYVLNGLKVKVTEEAKHNRTIYYYWPLSQTLDPMTSGGRKLFTIRDIDSLNGNKPNGIPSYHTSDKRIGCIPKGAEL